MHILKLVRLCDPQQYIKYTKCTNFTKLNSYRQSKLKIWFDIFTLFLSRNIEILETCFCYFLVQIRGWDGFYRIDELKLVCAISRKFIFGWKT